MFKLAIRTAAAAAAVLLSGAALAATTLSINTALTTADPLYKGLESFRDSVTKRTNGAIEVKLFPNSQLGSDEDVLEQARAGAPVAVVVDGGRLANFVKEFGVLGAPYLASGYDGMRKVVTSAMFDEWVEKLRKASGHEVLSFNWWQGERHLWTAKPVRTPADLKGNRMRTIGSPVWLGTINAMGATATPMPYAEVYSALEQKVIDSVEVQLPAGSGLEALRGHEGRDQDRPHQPDHRPGDERQVVQLASSRPTEDPARGSAQGRGRGVLRHARQAGRDREEPEGVRHDDR